MTMKMKAGVRNVAPRHARKVLTPDPPFERDLARYLLSVYSAAGLSELYGRFIAGEGPFDTIMRRTIWRALTKKWGDATEIRPGARFRHPETFAIGRGVHIGENAIIQGRVKGRFVAEDRVWIGPGCFLDARDLVIEEHAALGPGVQILGSTHTLSPARLPITATKLRIAPVRIGAGSEIGTGATILPGVSIGRCAMVGAGAVVIDDVPAYSITAGVPAKLLRYRRKGRSKL
jgi:acetyltransferase-like isoleucine patch superfamily enzyme